MTFRTSAGLVMTFADVTVQLYEERLKALLETKQMTEAQRQLQRVRQTRAEFMNILRYIHRLSRSPAGVAK